ncbi:hypothetical protein [Sinorhizobium fredii]|uniref:hypothetical protein n=1 Tax=Rhizobium fredii TaxID=380 RepID=UPI0009B6A9E9|nr:hypothetical protein [Sinorhizobium fredii]
MDRRRDLVRFYQLLDQLEERHRGKRKLVDCNGRMNWPSRGVYFFFEEGETRIDTGQGMRVVRVGTHALSTQSQTTTWKRLSQHRGTTKTGGGNHRGSIFRLIVGTSLAKKEGSNAVVTWGQGQSASANVRATEIEHERRVSAIVGAMPFLWIGIDDEPGPASLRGLIERNSIALMSNYNRANIDPPSEGWLGHHCDRERVRGSGLWNQNHVDETHDPSFLDVLERLVDHAGDAQ